jgi:hypothetical protein
MALKHVGNSILYLTSFLNWNLICWRYRHLRGLGTNMPFVSMTLLNLPLALNLPSGTDCWTRVDLNPAKFFNRRTRDIPCIYTTRDKCPLERESLFSITYWATHYLQKGLLSQIRKSPDRGTKFEIRAEPLGPCFLIQMSIVPVVAVRDFLLITYGDP